MKVHDCKQTQMLKTWVLKHLNHIDLGLMNE